MLQSLVRGIVSPGSACLIAAVPEEWVLSIPDINPVTCTITSDIILKPGYSWLKVVLVSRTRYFKEETLRDNAGLSWLQTVTGRSCGHNPTLHREFEKWAHHRWVILYHEVGTGCTYLIGKPGSGAILNLQYTNEKATVTTVTFTRQSIRRALLYYGDYTIDDSVIINSTCNVKSLYYYATGTEVNTIVFPELVGKQIIYISRSGMKDLKPILDPDFTLTKDTESYFDNSTGSVIVAAAWPWSQFETLNIIYK